MWAVLSNFWDDFLDSLWFVPAVMVAGAVVLSIALIFADAALFPNLQDRAPIIFGGTADAARTLLSVIAGSLITVIAVAFSITLIVIQQASSQFSPRLMRNFTSDRGNQIVLGTYIATFTYALMVLRQIRTDSDTQEGFVPALSISMSIVLALVSVGLLVYFIHHVVQSIQVTTILNSVRTDMDNELKIMFPGEFGSAVGDGRSFKNFLEETAIWQYSCPAVVTSQKQGYLRRLDEESIDAFAQGRVSLVVVTPCIGDYIPRGGN